MLKQHQDQQYAQYPSSVHGLVSDSYFWWAVGCYLQAPITGCAGWEDDMPYNWLRSGQTVSPAAILQEQGFSAEEVSANCDAVEEHIKRSAAPHSHMHDATYI